MKSSDHERNRTRVRSPQVKICGLTRVEEALACVELGAHAIGCVFYSRSPRSLTEEQARDICRHLPAHVWTVGVLVDENFSNIMKKVERCGLRAVQLHGRESPETVGRLVKERVMVIKGVYLNGTPSAEAAARYGASAYLVECGGGAMPGGNALGWNWAEAAPLGETLPLILAGGLTADNVTRAIQAASPDAVDVSSGVEAAPGRKDMDKVKRFLEAVSRTCGSREPKRIFPPRSTVHDPA